MTEFALQFATLHTTLERATAFKERDSFLMFIELTSRVVDTQGTCSLRDQQELAAIAQRIASNGDDPAEYIDVKYSVSERKFAAWPETLRRPFEAARTLKPAKPAFRLALVGEGK